MSCQRFDSEGLTGFPASPQLRSHFEGCADCQRAEGAYARLTQLLKVTSHPGVPRAGWEQRLTQRLAQRSRRRSWFRTVAVVGSAVAATVVASVLVPRLSAEEALLPTRTEHVAASGTRSATAAVGGTWKVSVDLRQEIRVWRNQTTLVLRCGASPVEGCDESGSKRIANVRLNVPGEYRAMVLTAGTAPLPEPVSFDEDARRARGVGASYAVIEPIVAY